MKGALDHEIHGWNECLIAYVLAASAPRYSMAAEAYHEGWVQSRQFINGRNFPDTITNANVAWLPSQPYNAFPRIHPGEKVLMLYGSANQDDSVREDCPHLRLDRPNPAAHVAFGKGATPASARRSPGLRAASWWSNSWRSLPASS